MKYEDLKTDEDFDKWYGRKSKAERDACQHLWEDYRTGNPLEVIYLVERCAKCGSQQRH